MESPVFTAKFQDLAIVWSLVSIPEWINKWMDVLYLLSSRFWKFVSGLKINKIGQVKNIKDFSILKDCFN
jgi:hypothetical protein